MRDFYGWLEEDKLGEGWIKEVGKKAAVVGAMGLGAFGLGLGSNYFAKKKSFSQQLALKLAILNQADVTQEGNNIAVTVKIPENQQDFENMATNIAMKKAADHLSVPQKALELVNKTVSNEGKQQIVKVVFKTIDKPPTRPETQRQTFLLPRIGKTPRKITFNVPN